MSRRGGGFKNYILVVFLRLTVGFINMEGLQSLVRVAFTANAY